MGYSKTMTREYGEYGRCEATAKSTGERCGQPATGPHGKCRYHGGASKKGRENGNFKHGGYSKYLSPENFTEDEARRVEALSSDLADNERREEVFRSFISDLWVRWDRTKDPRFARELRQTLSEFGYTPEEARELHVDMQHSGRVEHAVDLTDQQREHLDQLTKEITATED